MTKSPISVTIFGGASVVCMGVALVRCRTAFLLTLGFWGQFLARALESIEIEKEGERGGAIFLRSVLVRSKIPTTISFRFKFFSILIQLGDLIYRGF